MFVFLVHLPDGEADAVQKQVSEAYPGRASYDIEPHWFLVRDDNISAVVARKVGIGEGEGQATGFVVKLTSHYDGLYPRSFWDWLETGSGKVRNDPSGDQAAERRRRSAPPSTNEPSAAPRR